MLATAGIGITPTLSLLQVLVKQRHKAPVTVVHVARHAAHIPHWDEVLAAADTLDDCLVVLFLTAEEAERAVDTARVARPPGPWRVHLVSGRPQASDLATLLTRREAHVFICGPNSYIDLVRNAAADAGIAAARVHVDPFYSPPDPVQERMVAPSPGPWRVTWADGTHTTWVEADGTLLDHAEAAGIPAPAACRSGVCGTCSAGVHGGTATVLTPFADASDPGHQLLCCIVPTEDIDVDINPDIVLAGPARTGLGNT